MGLPIPDELVVLAVVLFLLSGILRWAFGGSERVERKLTKARDYGLLRAVATTHSADTARFVRDRLRRNGIRATTVPDEDGDTVRVLVFPRDAATAAELLLRDE